MSKIRKPAASTLPRNDAPSHPGAGRVARRALACVLALAASPASAQMFGPTFTDDDGWLDASDFLARGGFVPVPIIITEPAVEGGLGIAGYFVRTPRPGEGSVPTRTIIGAAKTGNDSKGGFAIRSGAFRNGDLLYRAALGMGTINLDVYPLGGDVPAGYTNESKFAYLQARYRIGGSSLSAGFSALHRSGDVTHDSTLPPALARLIEGDTTLNGLGFELHYDTRDNPITPKNGVNAIGTFRGYDPAWGSDRDFETGLIFGAAFHGIGPWTLAGMVLGEGVTDDAPFYMKPDIDLRGVPLGRYQGDRTVSTEIELTRQVHPRWSLLGFVGFGHAESSDTALFASSDSAFAYGAGFRYRLASKLGLDVGIDVARGPEDTIYYITFGHAWGRKMD